MHVQHLAGDLVRGQFAAVGDQALGSGPGVASLLPGGVVGGLVHVNGLLDPLDDLGHGDEVGVLVVGKHLVDPVQEGVGKLGVVLQPGRVVEETEGSSVLVKMSVEVVGQEVVELISSQDVGAGVNHSTAGQVFVDSGVLPSVQLVHDHLPDSVGPGGAVLQVTMASVGHLEVHSVGPERGILERGSD